MQKIPFSVLRRCLPGYCLLCESRFDPSQAEPNPIEPRDHLCNHCRLSLPLNLHCCYHCALPLPPPAHSAGGLKHSVCGSCVTNPLAHRALAPLVHQGAGAYLLHRLKFHGGEAEGQTLAQIMLTQIRAQPVTGLPDFLLPVPLDYWTLVKRGFNQSSLLAAAIGSALAIPVEERLITRRRGPAQRTLPRAQRQQLPRHRFAWRRGGNPNVRNKHIAVVDDVLTTGATARQMVRLLQQHGAGKVDVWCATRA